MREDSVAPFVLGDANQADHTLSERKKSRSFRQWNDRLRIAQN
jgi:hypothetical protein